MLFSKYLLGRFLPAEFDSEVRGSNSKMKSAAIFKISQQVSLYGILFFIWNQMWSGLITDSFLGQLGVSLSLNLASNEGVRYIADIWLK